jgi:hypothetical protein
LGLHWTYFDKCEFLRNVGDKVRHWFEIEISILSIDSFFFDFIWILTIWLSFIERENDHK